MSYLNFFAIHELLILWFVTHFNGVPWNSEFSAENTFGFLICTEINQAILEIISQNSENIPKPLQYLETQKANKRSYQIASSSLSPCMRILNLLSQQITNMLQ